MAADAGSHRPVTPGLHQPIAPGPCPVRAGLYQLGRAEYNSVITQATRGGGKILDWEQVARDIVDAVAAKLGEDILLLDIRSVATFADYFIIGSGNSERQLDALHREIVDQMRTSGLHALHSEGTGSSGWILLDYGAVVVHLFLPGVRRHYDLEHLWKDGRTLLRLL